MTSTIVIDERFCGPATSANGGYTCGLLASRIDGPAEVTLRAPPPLGTPLSIDQHGSSFSLVDEDGTLIGEARPTDVTVEAPEAIPVETASRAASQYPWRDRHPYPTCFVCGPERDSGDGLAIFPGPVDDKPIFAAPWEPQASLADGSGIVREEFVWAALDCPSGLVTDLFGGVGRILLGRLAADLYRPVAAEHPHVVAAWTIRREGRKLHTASALYSAEGELCAVAEALWIEVSEVAS